MASNDNAAVATGVFGSMTICCIVCLFVFGFPMLIAGIMMVIYGSWSYGVYVTGIIFIVIATLMAVVGTVAGILTCVYGAKTVRGSNRPPPQQGAVVVAPVIVTSPGTAQPVGYHGTQPQPTHSAPMYPPPGGAAHPPAYGADPYANPPAYNPGPDPYNPGPGSYNPDPAYPGGGVVTVAPMQKY